MRAFPLVHLFFLAIVLGSAQLTVQAIMLSTQDEVDSWVAGKTTIAS